MTAASTLRDLAEHFDSTPLPDDVERIDIVILRSGRYIVHIHHTDAPTSVIDNGGWGVNNIRARRIEPAELIEVDA